MRITDRIQEIEEELSKVKYNKATEKHIGLLKAKLSKLRKQLISSSSKRSSTNGFAVQKSGDVTLALIGFPSVGKSTLLSKLTNAKSKARAYAFTTLSVIPGMLYYNNARIQILDLPGIVEGAAYGRGRGREVISVARSADMLLLVISPFNADKQLNSIKRELEEMAIRLDKKPPEIYIEKKHKGGITLFYSRKYNVNEDLVKSILNEYGIHNANVIIRQDVTADDLIDVIEKNRVYLDYLVVVNKIDLANEKLKQDLIAKGYVVVSADKNYNIDELKERIFNKLNLISIYTKSLDGVIDKEPMILRANSTVRDVAKRIHRDLIKQFKYAQVWGKSVKFPGQKVNLDHVLLDGDIVMIVGK